MNEHNLSEGEILCTECGLCCQGVFHTYAHLNGADDIRIVEAANISTKYDTQKEISYFTLPCPAFESLCSIYPERPSVCSEHKCDLLTSLISKDTTLNNALRTVTKIKHILNSVLPELNRLSKNEQIKNPKYLMETVLYNLEDGKADESFKKEQKELLMNYGIFSFLKEQYFYKGIDN